MGKIWSDDGNIFIGKFKNNSFEKGTLYELSKDGTHKLFEVKTDEKLLKI